MIHRLPLFILSFFLPLLFLTACHKQPQFSAKPNPYLIQKKRERVANSLSAPEKRKERRRLARAQEQRQRSTYKKIKDMDYAELKEAKELLLERNEKLLACQYLERMITLGTDLTDVEMTRLELADAYFDIGDLERAQVQYTDYTNLYPGAPAVQYAEYKALLCCFLQTNDAQHDQTKTHEAIELTKKIMERKTHNTYIADVKQIQRQCIDRLYAAEVAVFDFYLNQNKLTAAEQRLAYLKEKFIGMIPNLETRILGLECALAQKQGNSELLREKQQELSLYANNDSQRRTNYGALF